MNEGEEFAQKMLAQFSIPERDVALAYSLYKLIGRDDDAAVAQLLCFLHPQVPDKIPGARYNGLFNNPSCHSTTASFRRVLSSCRLRTEDDPEADPYWIAWTKTCRDVLAFRSKIPEKWQGWRANKPGEDFPRDDETPQEYYDRGRREAKERHEARERAKLINAI